MIAMAERRVTGAGGTVAAIHTDSVMIPASPGGGLWSVSGGPFVTEDGEPAVRLLTWDEVDRCLAPFDRLRLDGARAWKGEHGTRDDPARPLHVIVFGTNRYLVFDPARRGLDGVLGGEVVHNTESHLGGVLVDPSGRGDERLPDGRRAWAAEVARSLVEQTALPEWTARPAVSVWRASSLRELAWLCHVEAAAQPFTSFLLSHPARWRAAPASGPDSGSPIASFDPDPEHWLGLSWRARDNGRPLFRKPLPVGAGVPDPLAADFFGVCSSVGEVAQEWVRGSDLGSTPVVGDRLGSGFGAPAGFYRRLAVEGLPDVALIGKEGDKLVEAQRQVVIDPAERLTTFAQPGEFIGDVRADLVRDMVERYGDQLAGVLPGRTWRAFLRGRALANRSTAALFHRLDDLVRDQLLAAGVRGDVIGESPRNVRYEWARRLLEGGAVVTRDHRVVIRCALPGCDKARRQSYPFCCREHEREAERLDSLRCEFPGCDERPKDGGRYCSDAHRHAMAERRRRARLAGRTDRTGPEEEPVRIEPKGKR